MMPSKCKVISDDCDIVDSRFLMKGIADRKRETWTSVLGHHMCAGSTTYLRISPAHPYPST